MKMLKTRNMFRPHLGQINKDVAAFHRTFTTLLVSVGCILSLSSCVKNKDYPFISGIEEEMPKPKPPKEDIPDLYLKDVYASYFPIGTCVLSSQLSSNANMITSHYTSLTAENEMKFESLQPTENNFLWDKADAIVDFVVGKNMKVRGHTLVWHRQTPDWVFKNGGDKADKNMLYQRMEAHIKAVMTRYKGKVYCWDVVNEVISDNTADYFRQDSEWYKIAGEEFVEKAFEMAHAADPDALLFYNDYNLCTPEKRDKVASMIQKLKEKGVPIHGVGMQAHYNVAFPSENDFVAAIDKFASLGCQVHITELDVSIYTSNDDKEAPYTTETETKQRAQYKMLFKVLREKREQVTSVSFWGISDKYSWLNNWPVENRKDYPLLFDRSLSKKIPFIDVVKF
ncbi:MAG: hypothetical protein RL662_1039 [Bacteroidota bacterium]|jgi:endo-1,4-beta-xylanase